MRKLLKMHETIIDMESSITFIKDRSYEIIKEYDDHYFVANQYNTPCNIGKEGEGIRYTIIEKE